MGELWPVLGGVEIMGTFESEPISAGRKLIVEASEPSSALFSARSSHLSNFAFYSGATALCPFSSGDFLDFTYISVLVRLI